MWPRVIISIPERQAKLLVAEEDEVLNEVRHQEAREDAHDPLLCARQQLSRRDSSNSGERATED